MLSDTTLKRLIQITLLIWFIAINVAILVPSYRLLFATADNPAVQGLPTLPDAPTAPKFPEPSATKPDPETQKQQGAEQQQQVGLYAQRVNAYTQQVAAYTQQLAALKAQRDAKDTTNRLAVYDSVVRNSLVTLVGGFATGLIAVVFANLGAQVANNFANVKRGKDPEPLHWL